MFGGKTMETTPPTATPTPHEKSKTKSRYRLRQHGAALDARKNRNSNIIAGEKLNDLNKLQKLDVNIK